MLRKKFCINKINEIKEKELLKQQIDQLNEKLEMVIAKHKDFAQIQNHILKAMNLSENKIFFNSKSEANFKWLLKKDEENFSELGYNFDNLKRYFYKLQG